MNNIYLRNGDSRELLMTLPDNSVDSCCTDPPYDLVTVTKRFGKANSAPAQFGTDGAFQRSARGFMGMAWDGTGIAFDAEFWKLVLRVLKPGGHLLAFGGTRTYHRMVCAIEDAGFEIRDQIAWHYASGFPKSHDVALGIDKHLGAAGNRGRAIATASKFQPNGTELPSGDNLPRYEPITREAKEWEGYGTALKPSFEPIVLARKPLEESSIARNVLEWRTGALNIDGCRVETDALSRPIYHRSQPGNSLLGSKDGQLNVSVSETHPLGRWPANTILACICEGTDHSPGCPVHEMDQQSGQVKSGLMKAGTSRANRDGYSGPMPEFTGEATYGDSGGASRFFYCAKPSPRERGEDNTHPTVKPIMLMRNLIRLVTPKGGVTLDPFMGSGTSGIAAQWEGVNYIGFEREAEYFKIARRRIGNWAEYEAPKEDAPVSDKSQLSMFE